MRAPTVALWGTGARAAAQAAACVALGWPIRAVVADPVRDADPLADELGAERLSPADLAAARRVDLVVLADAPEEGGIRRAADPDAIASVLASGHHLLLLPPIAATLGEADAIVEHAAAAARRGVRVAYGEAACAAPAVDALFARLPEMAGRVTHVSSKGVQPRPADAVTAASPLLHHGVHGIAAALLAARLTGLGRPVRVGGARRAAGEPVTEAWLHFPAGAPIRVHASFGPGSAPSWDLQVATADEVLRVDLFPSPVLEHNGDPLPLPAGVAGDAPSAFGFTPQLHRFWADVGDGRAPVLPSGFGREVLEVVCAAHAAADAPVVDLPFTGSRTSRPHELERPLPKDG